VDFGIGRLGRKPGGIRAAIALLALLPVLVPLVAALLIWLGERDANSAATERVGSAARVTAAHVRLVVESTLDRLRRYDEQLGPDPAKFRPIRTGVGEGFTGIYDADGEAITRTGAANTSPPITDNAEFKAMAGGKPWTVSPLLGNAGGLHFMALARRLERDGRFAGVVGVFLPADVLADTWTEVKLGADSAVGLIRSDGWLVTRYPLPPAAVNISGEKLFAEMREAPEGVFNNDASIIDKVERRVGYVSLPDLGLIATASMARTSMRDAVWARAQSTLFVAGPIFVAMVFLCGWAILLLLRHERSRGELEAALQRNRVLFQEIHHRVKNNLQQVVSLIRLQQAPAVMKEDLTRRITAMSSLHQHIYESDQFGAVDAETYLGQVLTALREAAPPGVSLTWKLAPLQLSPDQALSLGMLVNEVVSNAFKHAFPAGKTGKVDVTLTRSLDGPQAELVIADNGVGMGETPSGGQGLGTRLIGGLAAQLQGKVEIDRRDGVTFTLKFEATPPETV
jgi:two-component sensor histidine kinase